MAIHIGSWGLPDFGITEAIGKIIGAPTTPQGGSNLDRSSSPTQFYTPPSSPAIIPTPTIRPSGGGSPVPVSNQSVPNTSQPSPQQNVASLEDQYRQQAQNAYNSGMDFLNSAESNVREQLTSGLADVDTQSQQQQRTLSSALEEALNTAKKQGLSTEQVRQNAKGDISRAYQGALQRGQSMFGQGSSAGGAYGEIISQTMLQNFGNIDQNYQSAMDKINQYEQSNQQAFQLGKQKLDEDVAMLRRQIQQEANNKILEISQNRTQLSSQLAGTMMNLLSQSIANAQALANYEFQANKQLQLWQTQQSQQASQAKVTADQLYQQLSGQTSSGQSAIQSVPKTSPLNVAPNYTNNALASAAPTFLPQQYQQNSKDELDRILNPWI